MVDNIDSDHLCYIYLASYSSPAEIPGKSILSSISITVQAWANDLNKTTFKNLSKNLSNLFFSGKPFDMANMMNPTGKDFDQKNSAVLALIMESAPKI